MGNKSSYLGEFEHVVLLAIMSLDDNAYGVTVREKLKKLVDRDVSVGALYATAERLQKKGLLRSHKAGATAERGGKAKRYFQVTAEGVQAVRQTKEQLTLLWQHVPKSVLFQGV